MKPVWIDRAYPDAPVHGSELDGPSFDTTLHRLSRWSGYASLAAVYIGIAAYFLA